MFILPIIVIATIGIFILKKMTGKINVVVHKDVQIDAQIKFQSAQLVLALVILAIAYFLNPANFKLFFRLGDLSAPISGINWLGVQAVTPWWEVAATIGLWITVGTTLFMVFQLRKANVKFNQLFGLLPWVVLFSAMNAFTEESIFRIGIVAPLYGQLAVPVIILVSGVMFGIPHYFGMPKGILGALMAGFLGWLLAMSVVETHGLFLGWTVHFVQDVVIIASLFLIGSRPASAVTPVLQEAE